MFLSASPAACNVLSYTGPNASPEQSLNETTILTVALFLFRRLNRGLSHIVLRKLGS